MPAINIVVQRGFVIEDPVLEYADNAVPFCRFTLAVTRWFRLTRVRRGKETIYLRCVSYGNLAQICKEKLVKGMDTEVIGHLQPAKDDPAGQLEVCAERVLFSVGTLEEATPAVEDA